MKSKLKQLIQMAWELEQNAKDFHWPEQQYLDFQNELREFPDEKISHWAQHLNPQMTLRHFQSLIVPLERELQKNPSDEDFLVTSSDRVSIKRQTMPLHIALDNWRSAFNVGSLFRTADGLGVEHLHLLGYTATPENTSVQKTSLSSHESVPWSYSGKTSEALHKLKSQGFRLIAFETSPTAKDLDQNFELQKSVMVFGNERFGLSPEDLKLCHEVRKIPMNGIKNSLNVAVCAALAIYEWKKQWIKNS